MRGGGEWADGEGGGNGGVRLDGEDWGEKWGGGRGGEVKVGGGGGEGGKKWDSILSEGRGAQGGRHRGGARRLARAGGAGGGGGRRSRGGRRGMAYVVHGFLWAFVNFFGKRDGLVHVSQMSSERVGHRKDVVSEGRWGRAGVAGGRRCARGGAGPAGRGGAGWGAAGGVGVEGPGNWGGRRPGVGGGERRGRGRGGLLLAGSSAWLVAIRLVGFASDGVFAEEISIRSSEMRPIRQPAVI